MKYIIPTTIISIILIIGALLMISDIWKHIAKEEGGYVNHPRDPGGETKYGITKRSYPHLDIKSITLKDAENIFRKDFFKRVKGEDIMKIDAGVALHVADMSFNAGPRRAVRLLQRALNNSGERLSKDGRIGPNTLNALDRVVKAKGGSAVIEEYRLARQRFYEGLKIFKTFGRGWTNRNNRTTDEAIKLSKEMAKEIVRDV